MAYAVTKDRVKIWYDVQGKTGDYLLLIAGTALDHHGWDSVIDEFSTRFRVITFDHRGTGLSDAVFPDGEWTTRDFARDIIAILDTIHVPQAHVYGHSMGGRIAQWVGADYPDRVLSLVIGGASVGEAHGVSRPADATVALTDNDGESMLKMFYTDEWIAAHADEVRRVVPNARTPEALQTHLHAAMHHDGWDALPRILAPTLVIHGSDDLITLAGNANIIAEHVTHAQLVVIEHARHVYWAGFPEADAQIIAFLDKHGSVQSKQS